VTAALPGLNDANEIVEATKKIVLGGGKTSYSRKFKGSYSNNVAFAAGETKNVKVRGTKVTGTLPFSFKVNYEGQANPVTLSGEITFTVFSTKIEVR